MAILIKLRFGASALLHGRNLTSIPFISIICFDWIATYHIKYFRLQLLLKFYVFPRQLQTWLIWQQELIFCWYGWKCKEVNVLISCHYLKVLYIISLTTADEFIKPCSLELFLCICVYVCTYGTKYQEWT